MSVTAAMRVSVALVGPKLPKPAHGPAVVIVVSSPHRAAAYEASQFCIDTVKRCVPMWKREIWEGGSAWSEEAQDLLSVDDVGAGK